MPGYAPLFTENASLLPLNANPLVSRIAKNALVGSTVGAAAGGATAASKTRVKGKVSTAPDTFNANALEVQTDINRASTAADVTQMKTSFTKKKASFVYPKDLSGNGGPAFTRS